MPDTVESEHVGEGPGRTAPAAGRFDTRPPEPEGPYRPDIGLRNGILISIALWLALISALIIF